MTEPFDPGSLFSDSAAGEVDEKQPVAYASDPRLPTEPDATYKHTARKLNASLFLGLLPSVEVEGKGGKRA